MSEFDTILTNEDLAILDQWQRMANVENMALERPVVPVADGVSGGDVGVVLGGAPRLSRSTQRQYEKKAAKANKRKAAKGKKAKRKRGHLHWKSVEATRKRNAIKRWTTQPRKSLCYGRGVWSISDEAWDRCIGHLWSIYKPEDMRPYRHWGYGTHDKPYTVYNIDIVHCKHGVVYSGRDQYVYDCSQPNALDIEKAPEGAMLFTEQKLTLKRMKKLITLNKLITLQTKEAGLQPLDSPNP